MGSGEGVWSLEPRMLPKRSRMARLQVACAPSEQFWQALLRGLVTRRSVNWKTLAPTTDHPVGPYLMMLPKCVKHLVLEQQEDGNHLEPQI